MNVLTAPLDVARFASGASLQVAESVFSAITGSAEPETGLPSKGQSVYEIAEPMLDLSSLIYAYVELRKEAKKRLFELAKTMNLCDHIDKLFSATDLTVLRNAIQASVDALKKFEKTGDSADGETYHKFVKGLVSLNKKFNISNADAELFKEYFHILSLPKTADDMRTDFILHRDWLEDFLLVFGGEKFNFQAILDMCDKDPSAYFVKVDDEHSTSGGPFAKEITHAIAVSDKLKRVYVVFRGSIDANDWITNFQANATDFLLPGFTSSFANDTPRNFGKVHEGMYNYLFKKTHEGISKGEAIMGLVTSLMKKNKGYTLFITGHCLGGALSTMMAFRAAALDDLKDTTVMNVSFASPFVGNQEFRNHFVAMEKKKKIKHLRVSNYKDVVPLIPYMTITSPPLMFYKHVGMNLRLYKSGSFLAPEYRIFYSKEGSLVNEVRNAAHSNVLTGISLFSIQNHLCPEYTGRLDGASEKLNTVSLDDLYSNKDITGWTYEESPEKTN